MQRSGNHNPAASKPQPKETKNSDDLLWQHLKTVPAFRALLRSVEARFYQHIELPEPVLDLGCGDGHFASLTFDRQLLAGIDPWWRPLQKAKRSGSYKLVNQGLGDQLPFANGSFGSVISNSVLEHIPAIDPVLSDVGRVLRPGGKLVVTMPSHYFTEYLGGAMWLDKQGFKGSANRYRRFFNKIARHAHTDPPEEWAARFAGAGLAVEQWQYYFSKDALHALEIGHGQGLPSALLHFLTGHWILAPWRSSLRFTERWLRPYYEEEFPTRGTMLLFIARKVSDEPPPALLPLAQPIALRVLSTGEEPELTVLELTPPAPTEESSDGIEDQQDRGQRELGAVPGQSIPSSNKFRGIALILFAVVGAAVGQIALRSQPDKPLVFLPWFGISLLALVLLSQRSSNFRLRSSSWAKVGSAPRVRRLIVLGFLMALIAYLISADGQSMQRVALALILWISAISLSIYALWDRKQLAEGLYPFREVAKWEVVALAGLFLFALLLRVINLVDHPFVLSGSEASIGLDAWGVVSGQIRNPFATSWLSNPTLPFYFLAIPLRIFGRTVGAIRLLSPLGGALGVVALYLVGRWLWGPAVALVAALLLAGSHLHIHYSRIGLTNIWDPLLTLLAIGFIYIAWKQNSRTLWLLAGLATGLNAYLFTSSHILPIILLGILVATAFKRGAILEQMGNILSAAAIALVVALPQIIYYLKFPEIYWERARSLGILQGNWLLEESIRTGQSTAEILVGQFWKGLMAFNFGIDTSNNYFSANTLLLLWSSILLTIGLALAIVRVRQFRFTLLLVWLGATLLFAGALLVNPPSSHRLLLATPAVYLLIAVALTWMVSKLFNYLNLNQKYLVPTLMIFAFVLIIGDLSFYFGRYQSEHRYGDRNTEIAHQAAEYLNTLESQWTVYFHGPPSMYSSFPTFPYLVQKWDTDIHMIDVPEGDALPDAAGYGNTAFILLPERIDELAIIQSAYPNGTTREASGWHADPLFYSYELQRQ